jgi:hypothetical protein
MLSGCGYDLLDGVDVLGLVAFCGDVAEKREGEIVGPDEYRVLSEISKVVYLRT